MRTLVYHTGALGDFVTILPLLRRFSALHPQARLTLLGPRRHGVLGMAAGYFDEVWDVEERAFTSLFSPVLGDEPAQRLASIEAAIAFADDSSPVITHLLALGFAPFLHQAPFPAMHMHVVDYHLALLGDAQLSEAMRRPFLSVAGVTPTSVTRVETGDQRLAAIHPGSGSHKKNWPLERFVELAGRLRTLGFRVAWILGEAESGVVTPQVDQLVREPTLTDLAALLSSCTLYVGNDSGVTHLAAAVGCPTIALFGLSDAAIWAPRGERVLVVQAEHGDMQNLRVDHVLKSTHDVLSRSPCR
jgi:ADP-heptose:LPS heptosyltransferase